MMVSTVMCIQQSLIVCAAALVVSTSTSYAGPCSKEIARFRAEMQRRAPEQRSKEAMAAADRASAADRVFDKTACEAAISDAWRAFRK
jgi:hypothetical protein